MSDKTTVRGCGDHIDHWLTATGPTLFGHSEPQRTLNVSIE